MQKVAIIAAMSENRVIGRENSLPWDLPDDLKNFRRVTAGKAFLMGRNSFESEDALLSEYRNIILSSGNDLDLPTNARQAKSMEEAFDLLREEAEFFILGGAQVFAQTIDRADYLYLTIVHASIEGDAFFPAIRRLEWELLTTRPHPKDKDHRFPFSMNVYRRKQRGNA